jgi:hypothetical protein
MIRIMKPIAVSAAILATIALGLAATQPAEAHGHGWGHGHFGYPYARFGWGIPAVYGVGFYVPPPPPPVYVVPRVAYVPPPPPVVYPYHRPVRHYHRVAHRPACACYCCR